MDNFVGKIKILEELGTDMREYRDIDVEKGYRNTLSKIKRRSRKALLALVFNKAAAVLVLPLLLSTSLLACLYVDKDDACSGADAIAFEQVTAVAGAIVKTTLPDESEVWLNSGSTLRYPTRFSGGKRAVELTGEAFFNVETCPEIPFEVTTPSGLRVVASGTSFNVKAYDDDSVHEVILKEGRVDAVRGDEEVTLMPCEMASLDINSGQIEKTIASIDEKIGWKKGLSIFRNTQLEEVLRTLSRRYNVELNIRNRSSVNYRVYATFSTETVPQILDILKLVAPISWSVKNAEQKEDMSFSRQQFDIVIK